jgi:hypothetical protein
LLNALLVTVIFTLWPPAMTKTIRPVVEVSPAPASPARLFTPIVFLVTTFPLRY